MFKVHCQHQRSNLAAAALAMSILVGAAASADAQVVTGNTQGSLTAEQIQPQANITLTIKKSAPNPFDEVPEGQLPPGLVQGITFTLQQVKGIDVTTAEGYAKARQLTVAEANRRGVEAPVSRITTSTGEAVFTALQPGLYLLTETPPNDPSRTYSVSEPMLIMLPLGSVDGTRFETDSLIVVKGVTRPPTTTPSPPPTLWTPRGKTTTTPRPTPWPTPGSTPTPERTPGPATSATPVPPGKETSAPGNQPGQQPSEQPNQLSNTGANVVLSVLLALAMIAVGLGLIVFNRRTPKEGSGRGF